MSEVIAFDWMPTDEEMLDFRERLLATGVCPPARGWEWTWMGRGDVWALIRGHELRQALLQSDEGTEG